MNKNKYMTMEDIIKFIENMAKSQGYYGRLLLDLNELKENEPEEYNKVKKFWENCKFKDELDFVFFVEGC